jgi:hypothetical protein
MARLMAVSAVAVVVAMLAIAGESLTSIHGMDAAIDADCATSDLTMALHV